MPFAIITPQASPQPNLELGAAIARVHVEGWQVAYGHLLGERFYDDAAVATRTEQWAQRLTQPGACARTRLAIRTDAEGRAAPAGPDSGANPEVIGFATVGNARDDDRTGLELWALYILSEHYGTSVGQALLDAAIGSEPATLWVAEDNPRARSFYARNGFTPDGTRKIDAAADDLAEIRMVRDDSVT
ncbi:N-acetyltransferase [Brevibacterium luteolum]|uniref:GNAT family N-acetyltransferase n=1 Tax=Brevibacterium luteolum TaxID=199591 RepID=UPI001C228E9B|nr:GNAT family N-acetyltransferase [Brevibacterium luteolum]MBU8578668.1 GNAT family N-acetyltransferase [Brevibacterium luteolum]